MSLKGIRIGDLDRKFQFENFVETIDPIGNTRVESYTLAFTVPGKLTNKQGNEIFESNQQVAIGTIEIVIRYNTLISTTMRVKDIIENDYYYVRSVDKMKREGICVIQAETRDNQ